MTKIDPMLFSGEARRRFREIDLTPLSNESPLASEAIAGLQSAIAQALPMAYSFDASAELGVSPGALPGTATTGMEARLSPPGPCRNIIAAVATITAGGSGAEGEMRLVRDSVLLEAVTFDVAASSSDQVVLVWLEDRFPPTDLYEIQFIATAGAGETTEASVVALSLPRIEVPQ